MIYQLFGSNDCSGDYTNNPSWGENNCLYMELFLPCNSWFINLTLQPYPSLFSEGFDLCMVGFTAAMRARRCSSSAPLSVHFGVLSLRVRIVKFTAHAWVDSCKQTLLCVRVVFTQSVVLVLKSWCGHFHCLLLLQLSM